MKQIPTINFVQKEKLKIKFRFQKTNIINTICLVVLVIYVIGIVSLLSYTGILNLRLSILKKQVTSETKSIESLSATESKYILLKDKTSSVLSMTNSMYKYQNLIKELFTLFPIQLSVDGFSVDDKSNITFNAKSSDPIVLFEFINNVSRYNLIRTSSIIKLASIERLNIDASGLYSFQVSLRFENL